MDMRAKFLLSQLTQALFMHRKEGRVAIAFLLIFYALQSGYDYARGTALETLLIDTLTVRPAAFLINEVAGSPIVVAQGAHLMSAQATLNILNGCEGIESIFILVAAMLAFARPWREKLIGIMAGAIFVYGLNQIRLVALYFSAWHDRTLFHSLHSVIAPTLIILLACLFFLAWASLTEVSQNDPPANLA